MAEINQETGYPEPPKIDLSKIKNTEALKKASIEERQFAKDLEEKVEISAIKRNKSKFNFTEEYEVELPSKGIFYKNEKDKGIRKGYVTIRPMSVAEEEILSNKNYLKSGSTFRRVFDACICNDFEAKKLCSYDAYYLMYALRKYSYGDEYDLKLTCPDCEAEYDYTLDISEIPFEELDESLEYSRTIKLPVSRYTVVMHVATLEDDEELEKLKRRYPNQSETVLTYYNLTDQVLDNEGDEIPMEDWMDFFNALPVRDKGEIVNKFEKDSMIPEITVICPKCGAEHKMAIPMQAGFFRVRRE